MIESRSVCEVTHKLIEGFWKNAPVRLFLYKAIQRAVAVSTGLCLQKSNTVFTVPDMNARVESSRVQSVRC